MATAAERTSIIGLVVGMVGAAPGATILAELEALFDGGLSLSAMAEAIATNPAFNGDTGLYPAFLPNAIFATNFVTDLIGDEVSAANLQLAIDAVTAELNAGTSRGAIMFAAINAVAAVDPTDPDFGAAAQALLNKTAVAEYYSVTVAQSGATIADLQAALAGVDSTAASVTAANAAIDTAIAANQDLADLIANKAAAEAALAAAEAAADGDGDDETSIDSAAVQALIDALDAGDLDTAMPGYDAASENVKAAMVTDKQTADATALAALNVTLAGADDDVDDITGLASAIAVFQSAVVAKDAADEAAALAVVNLTQAEDSFNVTAAPFVATPGAGGTYTDGTDPMIIVSGTTLVLAAGVTETTHEGVTALLAASLANQGAILVAAAADQAVEDALDQVENLDYAGSAQEASLAAVGADMDANVGDLIDPADVDAPTLAEIEAQSTALAAGVAQLEADIEALVTSGVEATDEAAHASLTAAAVADGFIDAATKTAMDTDFDTAADGTQGGLDTAIVDSTTALGADNLSIDFEALVTAYLADGNGAQTIAAATAPVADAYLVALAAVEAQEDAIADLAEDLATRATLLATLETLEDLEDAVADADDAFGDAGFGVPVTLNSAVKAATADDDVFLVGGINSQIISFAGDDQLFIGSGLTLNADTTAGDNGDNSVLEVWITGTTNTVITIEKTVFGSEAAVPETYAITLTGVAAASVELSADGILTIA